VKALWLFTSLRWNRKNGIAGGVAPLSDKLATPVPSSYFPHRDTQLAAESVRLTAIRRISLATRVRRALDLSEWARGLARAALRERHPHRSDLELVELLLGVELVPAANSRKHP
jgi:hypothetical protein